MRNFSELVPKVLFTVTKQLSKANHQLNVFFSSISQPERFTILVLAFFGTAIVFLTPIEAGNDEETHLVRVWELSALQLIPSEKKIMFPTIFRELSYRQLLLLTPVYPEFLSEHAELKLDAYGYAYPRKETRSVYSPPLLAPQALVMRYLGRALDFPAVTVFYVTRLAGLLSYLLLAWLAVRYMPFGKWVLALSATVPMAIFQASTISADTISNGIAFLFIAGTLAIAATPQVSWRRWIILVALFSILYLGKINIVPLALLPFLTISPSKFKARGQFWGLLVLALFLFLTEVVGWNTIAHMQLQDPQSQGQPIEQMAYILRHPVEFMAILAKDLLLGFSNYFQGWLAIYGYDGWPVPTPVYIAYPLAILATFFIKSEDEHQVGKEVLRGLLITFAITYIATVSSLYLSFTPVASPNVWGVQGRYFITVLPLLFLAFFLCYPRYKKQRCENPQNTKVPFVLSVKWIVLPALMAIGFYVIGLALVFRVNCGAQYYRFELCYLPRYKNLAPESNYSEPISSTLTLRQEIIPSCDGMSQLRFWLSTLESQQIGGAQITFRDPAQGLDLVQLDVSNHELPISGWYALEFPPDWSSAGKLYILTIASSSENQGPRIALSLKPEYPDGSLYENGLKLPQDIIFQWGCITGLTKWIKSY